MIFRALDKDKRAQILDQESHPVQCGCWMFGVPYIEHDKDFLMTKDKPPNIAILIRNPCIFLLKSSTSWVKLKGGLLGRGSGVYKVIQKWPRRCKCRRSTVSGNCHTHVQTIFASVLICV